MNLFRRYKAAGAAVAALLVCAFLPSAAHAEPVFEKTDDVVYSEAALSAARSEAEELPEAASFAVTIPGDFVPDTTPGRFVCRKYPLDSAYITVHTTYLSEETKYTNAERRAKAENGEQLTSVHREYTQMTRSMLETALNQTFESPLRASVKEFVSMTLQRESDGEIFPGFRAHVELSGAPKPVLEEIYILLSDDRIFTVTYARASDDEFEEKFRKSAASIRVY